MTASDKNLTAKDDKAITIKLGQQIRIVSGAPFKSDFFNEAGEGLPLIRVRDVNTGPAGVFYSGEFSREHLVENGDLLVSMDGDFKVVRWDQGDGLLNQRVCKIIPNGTVLNSQYLEHFLPKALSDIHRETTFTTVKHLSTKAIREIVTPLPPLDDQIRIAHLLGKVEGLIAQRKQHLQQLDDLLKSVFLEMFGDPVRNEKGWPVQALGSLSEVQGGLQVTSKRSENPVEVPYLRVANVYRDRLDLAEIKMIRVTNAEFERVRLQKGDLLVVEGHGNPEEVGRSAVWNGSIEGCVHQNHLIRVRVDTATITELYASSFINSAGGRAQMFKAGKTTSGLNTISSRNVKETRVPIPPIELQNRFANIVERVEALKSRYQQILTDLEALYGVLSQQAFKGELDLSRVALPAAPIEGESPVAVAVPPPIAAPGIDLPESDLLLPAMQDRTQLAPLLRFWLEAHRTQLGGVAFSLERFIAAAQTRLAERHPDNDFELRASDYEIIKAWVFEALATGVLTQSFDDDGNRIELKAVAEQGWA